MIERYSKTSLVKKIGIKENFLIKLYKAPENYLALLHKLPKGVTIQKHSKNQVNFIHIFLKTKKELEKNFQKIKKEINKDGMIWISWPKKNSSEQTDVDENSIREFALKNGMVDVKVCAVDEVWSALRLVYGLKDR